MVTEKQLVANRENALKGGVETDEGKAIVRLNAMKHGLLYKDVLLRAEDENALAEIRERFISDLKPEGAVEEMWVDRIVSGYWRLARAIKIETRFIQDQLDPFGPAIRKHDAEVWGEVVKRELGSRRAWLNLMRYETAIERGIYKAYHELIKREDGKGWREAACTGRYRGGGATRGLRWVCFAKIVDRWSLSGCKR